MKARVIETGEFVEITKIEDKLFIDNHYCPYEPYEIEWEVNDNDYWTRLEHTYAGMAMQGILSNGEYLRSLMHTKHDDFRADEVVPSIAVRLSHALVEKMKEVK